MNDSSSAVLDAAQIEEFKRRGVLRVDFGFTDEMLEAVKAGVYPLYDEAFQANPVMPCRKQDAWKEVEAVRQLAAAPQVLKALEQLLGRKALPFQTLNFPIGTSQMPHSDTIHFSTDPAGFMVGVWVALEDIDLDNGPLIYYPGSHELPYFSMQDLGLESGYDSYPDYEVKVQELIREHGFEPEYGVVNKGEALIWHANLLHGGAPQKTAGRSRHSQVTHYFFEGCKYYTPMLSSPGKRTYRTPEWIPQQPLGPDGVPARSWLARLRRRLGLGH